VDNCVAGVKIRRVGTALWGSPNNMEPVTDASGKPAVLALPEHNCGNHHVPDLDVAVFLLAVERELVVPGGEHTGHVGHPRMLEAGLLREAAEVETA
jgi:hypothetical protein